MVFSQLEAKVNICFDYGCGKQLFIIFAA